MSVEFFLGVGSGLLIALVIVLAIPLPAAKKDRRND